MLLAGGLGGDGGCQGLGGGFSLIKGVGGAEGQAERAGDFGIGQTDGGEDVGFGTFVGGTSGTGGRVDFLRFKTVDEAFGVQAGEADRAEVGELVFGVAKEKRGGQPKGGKFAGEGLTEASVQGLIELTVSAEVALSISGGNGEANHAGDVLGAAAETAFLAAAESERLQGDAVGLIESADTFGAAAFGGVDGEQVNTETGDVQVQQTESLGGVGVEVERSGEAASKAVGAGGTNEGGDFGEGLDGAELVVGERDGDKINLVGE